MKFIKWFLGLILLVIIAVVAVAYVFLRNFDLNKYKVYAENLVYEQTGRKLTAGDSRLIISLIPSIELNDVSFANPEWAKNPQMITVDSLELRFALLPLLSKQIVIEKAILKQPKIYLETNKKGENSWDITFGKSTTARSATDYSLIKVANASEIASPLDMLSDFVAREVAIEGGKINYYKQADNSTISLDINSFTFNTDGINSPMNVSWNIVFNGMEFSGSGEFGSLAALFSATGEYQLQTSIKALGIKALFNSKIKNIMNNKLSAEFDYNIYNPAGNLNAPETTLIGTGNATLQKVNLNLDNINIVNNQLKGTLSVDISSSKPLIKADISGTSLNLSVFNVNSPTAVSFELIKSAQASTLVPNQAIPFDLLQTANAEVALKLGKLIVNSDLTIDNIDLKAKLNNGILNVKPLTFNLAKGEVDLTATANASTKSVAITAMGKNVVLGDVIKDINADSSGKFGLVSGGNTQTSINIKASGSTLPAMVNSLNGEVIAIVEASTVQSGKISFLTNDLVTQLLTVLNIDTSKSDQAELKCAVVRGDIKDGVITFPKGIAVNSDKLDLVSNGTVNLRNDKLNLSLNAYRSSVSDVSIVQALSGLIKISGTIQSPKVAIDETNTIKTIAGTAISSGLTTGAQLILDKDTAPCYTALQGTAYANKFEKPSGVTNSAQKTYQQASEILNDGIDNLKTEAKNIKDSAKNLLKNIKNNLNSGKNND